MAVILFVRPSCCCCSLVWKVWTLDNVGQKSHSVCIDQSFNTLLLCHISWVYPFFCWLCNISERCYKLCIFSRINLRTFACFDTIHFALLCISRNTFFMDGSTDEAGLSKTSNWEGYLEIRCMGSNRNTEQQVWILPVLNCCNLYDLYESQLKSANFVGSRGVGLRNPGGPNHGF